MGKVKSPRLSLAQSVTELNEKLKQWGVGYFLISVCL